MNYASYDEMVSDNGKYVILAQVSDMDYQGETRYFLFCPEDGCYGFTTVGWGSCSYCDPFEGCISDEEREDPATNLRSDIRWFSGMSQAKNAVAEYDFEGNYCGNHKSNEKFKLLVDDL